MLERAASASSPASTPDRNDPSYTERPSWGARQGGPRPAIPIPIISETSPDQMAQSRHWAKLLLDTYSARTNFFPDGLFADPAWDMLLDLMHARLNGKQISVSSLCIAARVPATTALRRIGDLVSSGLAARVKDVNDGRRVFIELTPDGLARMERYLDLFRTAMAKPMIENRRQG
ncbi:MAG: hypothetical protein ACOH12_14865 [Parvibaculaceae bacterium]